MHARLVLTIPPASCLISLIPLDLLPLSAIPEILCALVFVCSPYMRAPDEVLFLYRHVDSECKSGAWSLLEGDDCVDQIVAMESV